MYYNYRHYNPMNSCWCGRDKLENITLYSFITNSMNAVDVLGRNEINVFNNTVYMPEHFGKGVPNGGLGFFQAAYVISKEIVRQPEISIRKDATCKNGCRFYSRNGRIKLNLADVKLSMWLPKLDPKWEVLGVSELERNGIVKIIAEIEKHEYSHYEDFKRWEHDVNGTTVEIPEYNSCERDDLLHKNSMFIKDYTFPTDLSLYYEETHRKLGRSIRNIEEVIYSDATIELEF